MTYVKPASVMSALLLGIGGLSACAAANTGAEVPIRTASQGPDACFRNSDITNVNVVDEQTLYVSTRRGHVYRLESTGRCYSQGVTISVGGPGAGTCVGSETRVAVGSSFRFPSVQCIAQITGPYTDSRTSGLLSRTQTR